MVNKPNKNEKPGKGNKDDKPNSSESEDKMTKGEILLMTILQLKHPNGITDEQWAAIAPIGARSDAASKEYYGKLLNQHAYSTKDFVRQPVVIKSRKRVPNKPVAPVPEGDNDNLDDGDDVPSLRGPAPVPALALPRPSQTRPDAQTQRQRAPRGPRGTGAAKGKENTKITNEGGKKTSSSASKNAGTSSSTKRKNDDSAPHPSKRQASAKGNTVTEPASPLGRIPAPADSFDEPMSALSNEYSTRLAERRQAREREEEATRREWGVQDNGEPEGDGQAEEEGQSEKEG